MWGFILFCLVCLFVFKGEEGGCNLLSTIPFHPTDCRIYRADMGNQAFTREYNEVVKYLRSLEVTKNQPVKPEIVFHFGRICFTLLSLLLLA